MATDQKKSSAFKKVLERTKQIRKDAEANQTKFEKVDWFIPVKGDNSIRILPGMKSEDDFFVQVRTHFMPIKKKDGSYTKIPVRCLQDFEEDCPVCQAFTKMVKSDNAKKKEEASWLRPQTKFLVNIINYADRKVQPYGMALSVFSAITGWMEEFGTPIYDVEEGYDFKVIKKLKGGKTEYEVRPSMKPSAVPEKLRALTEATVDLSELYKQNERTKMEEYVETLGLGESDDEDEDDGHAARAKAAAAKAKLKAKARDDEDEEEDEDEDEEEVPRSKMKASARDEDEDEEEDEDEDSDEDSDEDEDEDDIPENKLSSKGKTPAKKSQPVASKKKSVKDDDDEFGVDLDDDDLDKEFEDLNV